MPKHPTVFQNFYNTNGGAISVVPKVEKSGAMIVWSRRGNAGEPKRREKRNTKKFLYSSFRLTSVEKSSP